MNSIGDIIIPRLKMYYEAIETKTQCYLYKNRHVNQWNEIEVQGTTHASTAMWLLTNGIKAFWKKYSTYNKWHLNNQISHVQDRKYVPNSYPHQIINSKWVKHINVRHENLTLVWGKQTKQQKIQTQETIACIGL